MAGPSKRTIQQMADALADRRAAERVRREARGRTSAAAKDQRPVTVKELVNPHTRNQGTYQDGFMPDLSGRNHRMVKVIRNLYPHVVDRWLAEGGPGFEDPQRAAIDHCRGLWAMIGERRLVANYTGVGGGDGEAEGQAFALRQLAEYQKDIPTAYWRTFENVVRFDMAAGSAGSHLARTTAQQQAHAKAAVGFVASMIAQWRGY